MDFDTLMRWGGLAALVLTIINTGWIIAGRAAKPVNDKITALDGKVDKYRSDLADHDRRIQKVENDQHHAPTGAQVTDLRLSIAQLDGHVKRLDSTLEGLTSTVRRMDEYLRSEKA
jgi:predicted RNase H-like nuclease (RuvC/YqgF family)